MARDRSAVLAEPLERFTAFHAETLRHRPSADIVDLSFPNPMVARDTRAFDLLRNLAASTGQHELQYTPMGGGAVARRKVAVALTRRTNVRFSYQDIVLTPGATAALNVAFTALFDPGDEIVVVTPCWMDYPLYLDSLFLTAVRVPSDPDKRLDTAAIAKAIGPRTAGLVIGQPVCPTGVVHSARELLALSQVLRSASERIGRPLYLVSDEAHRDQVWGDVELTSPVDVHPDTVCVYSFGKAWSLQGQRTGYLAASPRLSGAEDVRLRLHRALRSTGTCAPTSLMQLLASRIANLDPDTGPLGHDQTRFRQMLDRVGLTAVPGQATAFVYVRCPAGRDDWEFVRELADEGVLAMPSSIFHEPNHVRFALNIDAAGIAEVERRLEAVVRGAARTTS